MKLNLMPRFASDWPDAPGAILRAWTPNIKVPEELFYQGSSSSMVFIAKPLRIEDLDAESLNASEVLSCTIDDQGRIHDHCEVDDEAIERFYSEGRLLLEIRGESWQRCRSALDGISLALQISGFKRPVYPQVYGRDSSALIALVQKGKLNAVMSERYQSGVVRSEEAERRLREALGEYEETCELESALPSCRVRLLLDADTWNRFACLADAIQGVFGESQGLKGVTSKSNPLAKALLLRSGLSRKRNPQDQILDIVRALECIVIRRGETEPTFRFGLRLSWLASPAILAKHGGRTPLFKFLKDLYAVRSAHAHGVGDDERAKAKVEDGRALLDSVLERILSRDSLWCVFSAKADTDFQELMESVVLGEPSPRWGLVEN